MAGAFGTPIVVPVRDFTIPGPAGEMPVRHYRADSGAPLLVFLHGGGFVLGDLDTHDALCRRICHDAGVHVLSVDYRLAPEHKAPAAAEDSIRRLPLGGASTPTNWAPIRNGWPSAGTAPAETSPRWSP